MRKTRLFYLLLLVVLIGAGFLWGRLTAPADTPVVTGLPPTFPPTATNTIPAPLPPAPTPLPQLANHCAATGNTYWVGVTRAQKLLEVADLPIDKQTTSPSGEFTVYQAARKVYVSQAGTGDVLKIATGAYYDLSTRLYWSGARLAFVIQNESYDVYRLYIYDFSHGLAAYEATILTETYFDIWGWSPDGEYLMLYHNGPSHRSYFAVWSYRHRRIVYETADEIHLKSWSPDSRWLALVTAAGLSLVQVETGVLRAFELDHLEQSSALYPFWSPGSRYLLLIRQDAETNIYGIEGQTWPLENSASVWLDMASYDGSWTLPFFWLPGGEALAFWKHPPCCGYQLVRWSPDGLLTLVLETTVPPLFARGRFLTRREDYQAGQGFLALEQGTRPVMQDRIAVYTRPQRVELVYPDGTGAEVLIADAQAVNRLSWASDGRAIAGVWTTQAAGGTRVYLSWSGPERAATLELESDISFVHYLEWAPQDVALVLIVERPSGEAVIMVDPVTGTRTTLLDELEDAYAPTFYDQDGFFTLLWQDKAGQGGYDGYRQDGSRDFRVLFPARPFDRIFFSPDRQWAASKGYVRGHGDYLALVRTDGSAPQVVLSELAGVGHPLWSPDSRMVAYTTWTASTGLLLNILSVEGDLLWQAPYPYPENSTILTWQPCP